MDITFLGKDAILYIMFGAGAGITGAIVRIQRRFIDEDKTNDRYKFSDLVDIFIGLSLGILFALGFDNSVIISLVVGFFGPLLFNLLESAVPRFFASMIDQYLGKGAAATNTKES